jgi:hypothetical protein
MVLFVKMELEGQQFPEGASFNAAFTTEVNLSIGSGELAKNLPACAAGRTGLSIQICNRNGYNRAICTSFANGAKERIAFGAAGEAVGHVLNIAAGDNGAVIKKQGRTDAKFGVRRIRVGSSFAGGVHELRRRFYRFRHTSEANGWTAIEQTQECRAIGRLKFLVGICRAERAHLKVRRNFGRGILLFGCVGAIPHDDSEK